MGCRCRGGGGTLIGLGTPTLAEVVLRIRARKAWYVGGNCDGGVVRALTFGYDNQMADRLPVLSLELERLWVDIAALLEVGQVIWIWVGCGWEPIPTTGQAHPTQD